MKPRQQHAYIMSLYSSDQVILMHMVMSADEGRTAMSWVEDCVEKRSITVDTVRSWIADCGDNIPAIYFEEYYEQIDVDRWSDKTAIFDKDGNHVTADQFREGDILELAEMPFDSRGRHATGYAVWRQSAAGNYYWATEYDEK